MTSGPQAASVFRVLVTGSRTWTDTAAVARALDELHTRHGHRLRVVHGACPRGADAIAQSWATRRGVPVEAHPADWSTGRAAGPARNAAMVATGPDQCLAFIADDSPGATGTADLAEHAGVPTRRYTPAAAAGTGGAGVPARLVDQDGDQLIAVVDGPLGGQWFTWTDWQARLRAAQYMADRTGRRSPVLDYAQGGYQVANPVLARTLGWAAVHHPAQDAQGREPAAVTDDSAADIADVTDDSAADIADDAAGVVAVVRPDNDDAFGLAG